MPSDVERRPGSPPPRTKANDDEGRQDMGGKHGGQAGVPKSPARPRHAGDDSDVVPKRSEADPDG